MFDIIPLEPRRETLAPLSEPKLFFRAGDLFIILHDPHRGTQEIIGTATSMRDAIRIAEPDDLTNDREVIIAPAHRIGVEGEGRLRPGHKIGRASCRERGYQSA